MATQRRQTLLKQRRRAKDEAEDDASVVESNGSLSEPSLPSDVDEDADADYSDLSEADGPRVGKREARRGKPRPLRRAGSEEPIRRSATSGSDALFQSTKETEMMMNGLQIADDSAKPETVDFDAIHRDDGTVSNPEDKTSHKKETFAEKKKRDHEEYRKKMETDPAFIPTRGAFFMHDQRTSSPRNHRGFGRGGRGGRGGPTGPFAPQYVSTKPNDQY
jgi:CASC3/Barentsz eIF4AIII binding